MNTEIFKNHRLENDEDKWFVSVSLENPTNLIECKGPARFVRDGLTTHISVPFDKEKHIVIKIEGDPGKIRIHSFPGGIHRCYARIKNNNLLVSNVVTALFVKNEKINLSGEVLLRQICNWPTPIDNLFLDVPLLDPSAVFSVNSDRKIVLESSNIKPVKTNINLVNEHILNEFDKICRRGQPLAVLLSAGIDSRLNLALCLHFSRIYKNEVVVYHEYKDKKEHDIAKHISDVAKIPFVSVSRDRFREEPLSLMLSPKFIEFHGGVYRESLLRWVVYMNWMRSISPDCTIIGMGAEAHKGKFYRDIKNLAEDVRHTLGTEFRLNSKNEKDFHSYESQRTMENFFTDFSKLALNFNHLSSQIDFVHHYAYTAKHSMARSPYFNLYLGLPFPFLGDDFLSKVFSLPKKDKADARISKNLISKLAPRFERIPFISGNQKGFQNHTYKAVKQRINSFMPKHFDPSLRGESIIWNSPSVQEYLDGGSSHITEILDKFIKGIFSGDREENIRVKCALRMYLFLRKIEKDFGIEFICK